MINIYILKILFSKIILLGIVHKIFKTIPFLDGSCVTNIANQGNYVIFKKIDISVLK